MDICLNKSSFVQTWKIEVHLGTSVPASCRLNFSHLLLSRMYQFHLWISRSDSQVLHYRTVFSFCFIPITWGHLEISKPQFQAPRPCTYFTTSQMPSFLFNSYPSWVLLSAIIDPSWDSFLAHGSFLKVNHCSCHVLPSSCKTFYSLLEVIHLWPEQSHLGSHPHTLRQLKEWIGDRSLTNRSSC